MSSPSFTSSIHVFCLALLFQIAMGVDPLFHFCSNSENFTAKGSYGKNLNKLIGDLYFKTPQTGFGLDSVGQYHDRTYGLSLCRGDVSSKDCKACIGEAGSEIQKSCPDNKRAIIWYDNCLLKYANSDFFGKIDDQNRFYMLNSRNVSDPYSFNLKTRELLSQLSKEAYGNRKMYAAGESKLANSEKLYGLVQCTRDLSSGDCKKCLDDAISELPSCCDGKEGGRVVGGSCYIRYEIYPFVKV
ncbi:unnamed protein product [Ilex paraguariensis]|uniref:Gnk2-homologous domain-containing protein n=1 Tax=Ilex paraguariensis TaxID=185542 RepID=A0ABC8V135_9AQUA